MCLICGSVFSNEAMKPSRLKDHLNRMHPHKINCDFRKMKNETAKQPKIASVFQQTDRRLENGLIASYNLSLLIAKSGKAHTIGEDLLLPAAKEVIETVLERNVSSTINAIPLSNDSVKRRIDEMRCDIVHQLVDILKDTQHSLQVDESTLMDNASLLLGYVRFVHNKEAKEEMLFAINMQTDTKASSVFNAVTSFYSDNNIPLSNIIQCATDGAAAMVGKNRGFITLMKNEIPHLVAIHCVIHRQHLAARNLSQDLKESLSSIIKAVNKIKSQSLNTRLFRELCRQNDEDFERLLLHTEVRWLSKGAFLNRFF